VVGQGNHQLAQQAEDNPRSESGQALLVHIRPTTEKAMGWVAMLFQLMGMSAALS
jgi:hypothetical protein